MHFQMHNHSIWSYAKIEMRKEYVDISIALESISQKVGKK